ncbi:MAG: DUF3592 domain-containing protein [Clostridia bacterium]|nr:DUF3592 domain-containing protein [Clostridia bacterium]
MKNFFSGIGALVLALIFLAAGIFCIYLGADKINKTNSGKYVETKATITKIDKTETYDDDAPGNSRVDYAITVEYTVDGKTYVSQLKENPSEFSEGMELTVVYNVDDPNEVTLPGVGGAYIMIGLGVIGIIASGVLVLKRLRGR